MPGIEFEAREAAYERQDMLDTVRGARHGRYGMRGTVGHPCRAPMMRGTVGTNADEGG